MRGRLIFDEPRWWQRAGWRVAAAFVVLTAAAAWSLTMPAADEVPVVARTTAAPLLSQVGVPAPDEARAAAPAASAAAEMVAPPLALPALPALPAPPVSAEIAPGVHVTPLSVPPGTLPVPAGPRADDSEPEN